MRTELMACLRKTIVEHGWMQLQAAEHLGIGQSRVSDLVRGKWGRFSLDMLVTRTERRVELTAARAFIHRDNKNFDGSSMPLIE